MHHFFIVNPAAGKGRTQEMTQAIKKRFSALDEPMTIEHTKAPGHATDLARMITERVDMESLRIYAVGGDGTLNEVVNGIAGSSAELGIIPCGSGNDAVRSLYSETDPLKLIEDLPLSGSVPLDGGRINGRYFINIASAGFDAEVVQLSRYYKDFPLVSGSMAYILGVLHAVAKLKKYAVTLKIDKDKVIKTSMLLTIFANGSYYGGGMHSAPRAVTDDGLLDFYIVDAIRRIKLLRFFPAFRVGRHESIPEVHYLKGREAELICDTPIPVNLDGEISLQSHLHVEIIPGMLKVARPDVKRSALKQSREASL